MNILKAILALLFSGQSFAAGWQSGAALAYGAMVQAESGYEPVAGSGALFDVKHSTSDGLEIGLRSVSEGGRLPDLEFLRQSAGMMAHYLVGGGWTVSAGMLYFHEVGRDTLLNTKIYKVKGELATVSWEKARSLIKGADGIFGGYMAQGLGSSKKAQSRGIQAGVRIKI